MVTRKWAIPSFAFGLAAVVSFAIASNTAGVDTAPENADAMAETSTVAVAGELFDNDPGATHSESDIAELPDVGFQPAFLGMLGEMHARMLEEDLPLLAAEITGLGDTTDTVSLDSVEVVWAPDGVEPVLPLTLEARWSADRADLDRINLPTDVIVVLDRDSTIIGLAVFDTEEGAIEYPGASPLFLTAAAEQLFASQVDPVPPPAGSCTVEPVEAIYDSARDAIAAYFHRLGGITQEGLVAQRWSIESTAEQIVLDAPDFVDPVTGWVLSPAIQDVKYQLEDGLEAQDVVLRPALPIQVRVPAQDAQDGLIAVFIAEPSDRVLGFTVLAPHVAHDQDGFETVLVDRIVEIVPPGQGEEIAVYLRSEVHCPSDKDEMPVMRIPHEAAAGNDQRVAIDLEANTYTPIVAFVVPSVGD
jgi:hypothetical protein